MAAAGIKRPAVLHGILKTVSVEIKFMDKITIYCDGGSQGNP